MVGKLLGLAAISVLLSAMLVMAIYSEQFAEAKTSKQSPKHKFSKWHAGKVCGEELCKGQFFNKIPTKIGKGSPNR